MIRLFISLVCCWVGLDTAAEISVRLDFRPFQEKLSTWVELAPDGTAVLISYSPHTLEIARIFRGKPSADWLNPALGNRLWAAATEQPKIADLARHSDLFSLRLQRSDGSRRELAGQLADSAPSLRQDIARLVELKASLTADLAATVFLRAERLEEHQIRRLRDGGRHRLHRLEELPPYLEAWLAPGVDLPEFRAIGKEEYAALQAKAQSARLIYVITGERSALAGFEISVYLKSR